jgi:molybdopterin-synthase adenylyltransferase
MDLGLLTIRSPGGGACSVTSERFNRQILLFGSEGQAKLESIQVGIVGVGGIGSHVVQTLAYLGVKNFIVVDDDFIEESNLNRLIGATNEDVAQKTPKVHVSRRVITAITPDAKVTSLQTNLRSTIALDALRGCSIIFGCVDNDGARLILAELTAAYSIPLIDVATEIIPGKETFLTFGGRVVVARPGDFCLVCAEEIDMEEAKQNLESLAAKEGRRAHGYGLGEQIKAPAVVSLNGVVAQLAVTEFMMLISGLRDPNRYLIYRAERGVVNKRDFLNNPDCFTCHYLAGIGDHANIYRYVLPEN